MIPTIKDPEAHRRAQAISRATGQRMIQVVTDALRERHARIEHRKDKASVAELLAIADRTAAHLKRRPIPIMPISSTMRTACRDDPRHFGGGRPPYELA